MFFALFCSLSFFWGGGGGGLGGLEWLQQHPLSNKLKNCLLPCLSFLFCFFFVCFFKNLICLLLGGWVFVCLVWFGWVCFFFSPTGIFVFFSGRGWGLFVCLIFSTSAYLSPSSSFFLSTALSVFFCLSFCSFFAFFAFFSLLFLGFVLFSDFLGVGFLFVLFLFGWFLSFSFLFSRDVFVFSTSVAWSSLLPCPSFLLFQFLFVNF